MIQVKTGQVPCKEVWGGRFDLPHGEALPWSRLQGTGSAAIGALAGRATQPASQALLLPGAH